MKVGFIGTGSMGSILVESMIQSGALTPRQIVVSNRTSSKAKQLADKHPGISAAQSSKQLAKACAIIFLCVKPLEYKQVIAEIAPETTAEQIVVSITSPVQIHHLETLLNCKIAKIIPSITNYVCSGATLCIYGQRMDARDREKLESLLSNMSAPIRIEERYTRVTSDISSCGPALIAYFVQAFVDAAVEETGVPRDDIARLAAEMTLGTGELLTKGGFSPESLQQRVSVPGGITAEALKVLAGQTNGVFNKLIRTTQAKYEEDLLKLDEMFTPKKG